MNLLLPDPDVDVTEYGAIEHPDQFKQRNYDKCSKKTSILMSLLACCILAVGMFVWFRLIAKQDYGHIDNVDESDDIPPGLINGGGTLGELLLDVNNDNILDYKMVINEDWRTLWIQLGYDEDTVNQIDFHTYALLGVNYQQIYKDIINHNHPINDYNIDFENDNQIGKVPLFDDCGCNYCMGFCEDIYCPICMDK